MDDKTFTVAEASAILGLAPRTVRKWCDRLSLRKHGNAYVLSSSDIDWIEVQRHEPGRATMRGTNRNH